MLTLPHSIWYLIKTWIESHFFDFEGNKPLLDRLRHFLHKRVINDASLEELGKKLIVLLDRKVLSNVSRLCGLTRRGTR